MSDRPPDSHHPSGYPSDADWDAIARYLADESDPADVAHVRAWLATHPEDAVLVDAVKARVGRIEHRADIRVDTERALAAVKGRLAADAADPSAGPPLTVVRGGRAPSSDSPATGAASRARPWPWIGFAAAAGLAAVAVLSPFRNRTSEREPREYRTAVGQRDSVRLPDGSTVVLAPGSHLTLAADFGNGAREVTLEGAAFFDVQHDAARPFTVHTARADIRDIGTAFAVKTAEAGEVTVHVTHGIVALRTRGSGAAAAELRAGDRGVLAGTAIAVRRGTVTADDVAWTRGLLSYRDASLTEVRADLQRWYGLDLRVTDSALVSRTLTATFRGDSAAQVVRVIALAMGAEVVQQGDTVTLRLAGAASTLPR